MLVDLVEVRAGSAEEFKECHVVSRLRANHLNLGSATRICRSGNLFDVAGNYRRFKSRALNRRYLQLDYAQL